MADLAVGMAKSVVYGLVTKANGAIEEEGKLRQSVQRNLVFITGEFNMMQCFLKVTDSERLKNPLLKMWVQQIRELAYDVEDCLEFVVHLDKKNRWWLRLLKPASWLLRPCVDLRGPLPLDEAVDQLDYLKTRVEDVGSRIMRYNHISDSDYATIAQPDSHHTGGPTAFNNRLIEAANTYQEGLEVTTLLPEKDQDLRVISIWGTGGGDLRMASIAWNAYINKETCEKFPCRAWVKLTHPLDPHVFLRSLMAQFYAATSVGGGVQALRKMEEATRGDPLEDFEQLAMKDRYLVVLEDLSTMAEWDAVRRFLPNTKNGSCVILSTQKFEVASLSVGHPYQVLHLNQLAAEHSVYAFFTQGSVDSNNGLSISNFKKKAAMKWIDEHPLVGRELELKDLGLNVIKARAKSYQVMSVWGIAGVGKSALVKNMFSDKVLNCKLFQKYGWVNVSLPFNLWDFSRTLLSIFGSEYLQDIEPAYLDSTGSRNPIAECRGILKSHKCLVVIDGLQSTEEWDLIKADLVSGSHHHNVIIVVTSEQVIATHCRGRSGS